MLKAGRFLAVLIRMTKLYCRKKLTLKHLSATTTESSLSRCKVYCRSSSSPGNSLPRGRSGPRLLFHYASASPHKTPGCQSKNNRKPVYYFLYEQLLTYLCHALDLLAGWPQERHSSYLNVTICIQILLCSLAWNHLWHQHHLQKVGSDVVSNVTSPMKCSQFSPNRLSSSFFAIPLSIQCMY